MEAWTLNCFILRITSPNSLLSISELKLYMDGCLTITTMSSPAHRFHYNNGQCVLIPVVISSRAFLSLNTHFHPECQSNIGMNRKPPTVFKPSMQWDFLTRLEANQRDAFFYLLFFYKHCNETRSDRRTTHFIIFIEV